MTASGTIDVHTPIAGLIELALRDPSLHEVTRRAAERPADLDRDHELELEDEVTPDLQPDREVGD